MRKLLVTLLLTSPVYAQVFTEDIAKINHYMAEEELEKFIADSSSGLPGEYLSSLSNPVSDEAVDLCVKSSADYKPLNIRYELIAVTQNEIAAKEEKEEKRITTVFVAKIYEPSNEITNTIKTALTQQALASQNDTAGKFKLSKSEDVSKNIVLYTGPGTSFDVTSKVSAAGTYNLDVTKLSSSSNVGSNAVLQMDVVNRMSVKQSMGDGTGLKGSLESSHTTGQRSLNSLDGTKFELSNISAQARIDSKLSRETNAYSEINYSNGAGGKEVRAIAGFDIRVPDNAELLVFTGFSTSRSQAFRRPANESEVGFEYKKKGVSVYGKVKNGSERKDTKFETGIKINLGR